MMGARLCQKAATSNEATGLGTKRPEEKAENDDVPRNTRRALKNIPPKSEQVRMGYRTVLIGGQ